MCYITLIYYVNPNEEIYSETIIAKQFHLFKYQAYRYTYFFRHPNRVSIVNEKYQFLDCYYDIFSIVRYVYYKIFKRDYWMGCKYE